MVPNGIVTYDTRPLVSAPNLPKVIESIGARKFGGELLSLLHQTCGADHFVVFDFAADVPVAVMSMSLNGSDIAHRQAELYLGGQYWRMDPTMEKARDHQQESNTTLIKMDIHRLPEGPFRNLLYRNVQVRERILLFGQSKQGTIALSILRSDASGSCSRQEMDRLSSISPILLSVLGSHIARCAGEAEDISLALTSLAEIESCINAAPQKMPWREAQVCARIIYGVFTVGIAMELGVSEETVTTYRKRIYQRLGIGSQRELLLWYLRQWSDHRMLHDLPPSEWSID